MNFVVSVSVLLLLRRKKEIETKAPLVHPQYLMHTVMRFSYFCFPAQPNFNSAIRKRKKTYTNCPNNLFKMTHQIGNNGILTILTSLRRKGKILVVYFHFRFLLLHFDGKRGFFNALGDFLVSFRHVLLS